jgi:hypothetical protein
MNFLLKRKTPKNIDLTYESYALESRDKDDMKFKEILVKSKIKNALRDIFILHGAIDYDIPIFAPVQESATVFLDLRQ